VCVDSGIIDGGMTKNWSDWFCLGFFFIVSACISFNSSSKVVTWLFFICL